MSKKQRAKPSTDEPESGKKKRKKRSLLMVGVLVVVLGVAAGYLVLERSSSAQAKQAPKPGAVLKLDSIYLNLSDGHYLKLGMALQETAEVTTDVDGSQALDAAIELFSRVSMTELSVPGGRDAVKKELISKIQRVYEGRVMTVYYTEFVMQ